MMNKYRKIRIASVIILGSLLFTACSDATSHPSTASKEVMVEKLTDEASSEASTNESVEPSTEVTSVADKVEPEETSTVDEETEKKIAEYIQKAIDLANAGNELEAKAALNTAESVCGSSQKIDDARLQIEKILLYKGIDQAVEAKDYKSAIKLANACSKGLKADEEVIEKMKVIKQYYIAEILDQADAMLHEKGLDATLEMLNEAVKLLPDEELVAKRDYVQQLQPVVFDFESYIDNSGSRLSSGEQGEDGHDPVAPFWYGTGKDIYANEHENSVAIYWYGDNSGTDSCTLAYKMTGDYDKITGSMYLPFSRRKTDSQGAESTKLEVWGDGEKLASVVAKNSEGLVDFSVDITGVNLLELKFFSQMYFYKGSFLLGDGYNYIGFCDVMLEKNY